METSVVYDHLVKHNIKPSVQRMAVMDYLLEHLTHPSVDEIYSALIQSYPTLSRTTVYNTLKLLVEQGAATMLTIDEKMTVFDADVSPHAHFICKTCGRIYDIPWQPEDAELSTVSGMGHAVAETHRYYKGVCKNCLEK